MHGWFYYGRTRTKKWKQRLRKRKKTEKRFNILSSMRCTDRCLKNGLTGDPPTQSAVPIQTPQRPLEALTKGGRGGNGGTRSCLCFQLDPAHYLCLSWNQVQFTLSRACKITWTRTAQGSATRAGRNKHKRGRFNGSDSHRRGSHRDGGAEQTHFRQTCYFFIVSVQSVAVTSAEGRWYLVC